MHRQRTRAHCVKLIESVKGVHAIASLRIIIKITSYEAIITFILHSVVERKMTIYACVYNSSFVCKNSHIQRAKVYILFSRFEMRVSIVDFVFIIFKTE